MCIRDSLKGSPVIADCQVLKRATPSQTEWAYEFELQVKLKNPLRIR